MKKFLALVLALVMTMSLVTVSASAKTDFTDDAKITNEEAVEVLNAIGVLTGYADGSFRPQATLTRGAGAKIIAYLMLGQTKADKLAATYTVFKDVDDTVGLAAYIEWAAANGIVDGYGDGNFGPYNTLTEYAFGKMLLTALGYSSEKEGFTGAGWQKNVYRIATSVGVFDGTEAFGACNRETAARMALGALTAYTVKYGYVTAWDQNAKLVFTTNGAAPVDYMYNNYPGLGYNAGHDVWGRPGHTWTYKTWTKFYMNDAVKTYYTAVDECDLLVDLGIAVSSGKSAVISETWYNAWQTAEYSFKHGINHATCNDKFFGGQGVLTQVFVDPADSTKYIVTEIATYLAQVTDVTKTHAGKSATFSIWYRDLGNFGRADNQLVTTKEELIREATLVTDAYAVKDIVAVTRNSVTGEIVDIALATGVAGKLSGYVKDAKAYPEASKTYVDSAAKTDAFGFVAGYDASKTEANVGTNYAFYYDAYGNVIGMFEIAPSAANYGVVDAIWAYDNELGNHTIKSDFVTMDATMNANANVAYLNNVKASAVAEETVDENRVKNKANYTYYLWTYAVDANGDWTIVDADINRYGNDVAHLKANHVLTATGGELYMTEKTQILVRDVAGEYKSYVGYANLPLLHASYYEAITDTNGYATVLFINNAVYDGSVVTGYVANTADHGYILHTDNVKYYMYTIYVDGVATTAYVNEANKAIIDAAGVYEMQFKAVDNVVVVNNVVKFGAAKGYYTGLEITKYADGLINFNNWAYSHNMAGVAVYVLGDNNTLTVGSADDLKVGQKNVSVEFVEGSANRTLKAIYVFNANL